MPSSLLSSSPSLLTVTLPDETGSVTFGKVAGVSVGKGGKVGAVSVGTTKVGAVSVSDVDPCKLGDGKVGTVSGGNVGKVGVGKVGVGKVAVLGVLSELNA